MGASRAWLRPTVFMVGFFSIIVVPQALFHVAQASGWIPRRDLTWTFGEDAKVASRVNAPVKPAVSYRAREDLLVVRDGRFAQPSAVFGDGHDPDLVTDLRARMSDGPFAEAVAAEMAIVRPTSSVVVAQFRDDASAVRALEGYAQMMLGALPDVGADGTRTIVRANDVAKAVVAGRTVVVISAPDSAAVSSALASSPLLEPIRSTPTPLSPTASGGTDVGANFWLYQPWVLATVLVVLVLAATVWFFRVSAWATEVPAATGTAPLEAHTLRERLLAVNALDVPFSISASPDDPSLLVATWRYADAKWVDLARARGMRRTHRILMRVCEHDATVRPIEQMAGFDWSAGLGGADVRWVTSRGINFFEHRHERVFGLQLDNAGRLTPRLSYRYTFNVQEMKAPLIAAVTNAGWRWRPTMLHGPSWLAWLTD